MTSYLSADNYKPVINKTIHLEVWTLGMAENKIQFSTPHRYSQACQNRPNKDGWALSQDRFPTGLSSSHREQTQAKKKSLKQLT